MNPVTAKLNADHLLMEALQEDITSEDVTTNAVMPQAKQGQADLLCKQDGILAGINVFRRVFELLDENVKVEILFQDGDCIHCGERIAAVSGDMRVILSGERTALNYLQRMSGIATYTDRKSACRERV